MARGLKDRLLRRQDGEPERLARAVSALGAGAVADALGPPEAQLRAQLTALALTAVSDTPWPCAAARQTDPRDPAYLQPFGLHPVMVARDRTWMGMPGRTARAWVDPHGWCGLPAGPSVAVWFGEGRRGLAPGRDAPAVQWRADDGLGVVTRVSWGSLELTLHHGPVVLEGQVAWSIQARLELHGPAARPARLAFAIRPVQVEGVNPVFHIARDAMGLWTADGVPVLAVPTVGDEIYSGSLRDDDPWRRFAGLQWGGGMRRGVAVEARCEAGLASGAEVYRLNLSPDEPISRFAVLAPSASAPAALVRTTAERLRDGARADTSGLMAGASVFRLDAHQGLLRASVRRLLLEEEVPDKASYLGAVALGRVGWVRRAGDRLEAALGRVKRDGRLEGGEPEDGAVLAWAAAEHVRWTGARAWRGDQARAWGRLLDRLAADEVAPGGQSWFGPDGSARWSAIWRAAALLRGAAALRDTDPRHQAWAVAGGTLREALPATLGDAPWSVAEGRPPDGAAAALLVAAWLGLLAPDHVGVLATARALRVHHALPEGVWHDGGVHVAATALLLSVEEALDPSVDALGPLAALASPTGALPTRVHPTRGALGDGDDALSAALFALVALDRVHAGRGELVIRRGLTETRDLPTPFGRIDVTQDGVTGRWRDTAPRVVDRRG